MRLRWDGGTKWKEWMKPRKRRVAADQFHGSDFVRERGSTRTIIGKQRQYFGFFLASACANKLFGRQIRILEWSYLEICCVFLRPDFSAVSVVTSLCTAFFLDGQLSGFCGLKISLQISTARQEKCSCGTITSHCPLRLFVTAEISIALPLLSY